MTGVDLESHGVEEAAALPGPVLLVANHASELDAGLVQAVWPGGKLRVGESSARARSWLRRGRAVLYFPEGAASADGVVRGFDPELGAIAEATGAAVVPVGIRGSYAARPPGRSWTGPGRPRVSVRFGQPLTWRAPKRTEPGDEKGHLAFTVAIQRAVRALIEEDATSWWQVVATTSPDDQDPAPATWRQIWDQAVPPVAGGGLRRRAIWSR